MLSRTAYGGIKGVILPYSKRGRLLSIYGEPPKCNYCGKLGIQPKHNSEKIWLGNAWIGLTIDHIIPACLGGLSIIENYQILCDGCNQAKSVIEQKVFQECVK